MHDDDKILSEEEEGDVRIPPQDTADDEVIPLDVQEDVEHIPASSRIPFSVIYLLVETEWILLFNKRNYKG